MKSQQDLRADILARLPKQPTRAELIANSKKLTAAIEVELKKPVLPHPASKKECDCGGMLFTLEDGSKFCLNCGLEAR